jgi:general secretion pathway protein G
LRAIRRGRGGFSLAELMVVIVILGLLATLVVPNVIGYLFRSQTEIAKVDISNIEQAVKQFQINNGGKLPDNLEQLITPDANGHTFLDGKTVPKDPWKNPYVYETDGRTYRILSYGKDGQQGGDGENSDIDNESIKERK